MAGLMQECRKKDDGNGVNGKEERETKEKIFRCSERRYGESWCEGDGRQKQDGLEKYDTLWLPLIEGKGRKEKKKKQAKHFYICI